MFHVYFILYVIKRSLSAEQSKLQKLVCITHATDNRRCLIQCSVLTQSLAQRLRDSAKYVVRKVVNVRGNIYMDLDICKKLITH